MMLFKASLIDLNITSFLVDSSLATILVNCNLDYALKVETFFVVLSENLRYDLVRYAHSI